MPSQSTTTTTPLVTITFSLASVDIIGFLIVLIALMLLVLLISRLAMNSEIFSNLLEAELENRLRRLVQQARDKMDQKERQRYEEHLNAKQQRSNQSHHQSHHYSSRSGRSSKRARNPPKGPPPQATTTHHEKQQNEKQNEKEQPQQPQQPQSQPQQPTTQPTPQSQSQSHTQNNTHYSVEKIMSPILQMIEKKHIAQAIKEFEKSISNISSSNNNSKLLVDCLTSFGSTLNSKGVEKHQEAIPYLERAVSLDSENLQASLNLGTALFSIGKFELALPNIENAVRLSSFSTTSSMALLFLGRCLTLMGRSSEAVIHLKHALKNQPNPNIELTQALSQAYVASSEVDNAIELSNRFLSSLDLSKLKTKHLALRTAMIRDLLIWMLDLKFDGKRRQQHRPLIERWSSEFIRIKAEPETNLSSSDFSSIISSIQSQQPQQPQQPQQQSLPLDNSFDSQTLKFLERSAQLFGTTQPRCSYDLSVFQRSRNHLEQAIIALVNALAVAPNNNSVDDSLRSQWISELQQLEQQLKSSK